MNSPLDRLPQCTAAQDEVGPPRGVIIMTAPESELEEEIAHPRDLDLLACGRDGTPQPSLNSHASSIIRARILAGPHLPSSRDLSGL
jgi:hypothetical protein